MIVSVVGFVVFWPTKNLFCLYSSLQESLTVFPFFYVTFRKRSKRLTSACSSISWISCFTCACIRSNSIVTHRIDATAMGVGRTLVDIWENVVKLGVKIRDFAYAWWQFSVTLINYSATLLLPLPLHSPPPPPQPLETCIILHIIQSRNINWSTGSRRDVFVVRTSKHVENLWKNGLFWSRYSFVTHSINRKHRDRGLARSAYSIKYTVSSFLRATFRAPARIWLAVIDFQSGERWRTTTSIWVR